MFCKNCGKELSPDSNFCTFCGTAQNPTESQNHSKILYSSESSSSSSTTRTIQLRCKDCGGIMEASPDEKAVVCPFCGGKELILDSDQVAAQKIQSTAYKEVEMAKLQQKKETQAESRLQSEKAEQKAMGKAYRKGFLSKLTILLLFLSVGLAYNNYINHRLFGAAIAALMALLSAWSWLKGMQILKEKKAFFHRVLLILALLLFIPYTRYGTEETPQNLLWPKSGLATNLPKPSALYGEVETNSTTSFSVTLEKVSADTYSNYVSRCKEEGFTVDPFEDSSSYSAHNEEGYSLSLDYHSYLELFYIYLEAPLEMTDLVWPDSTLAHQIPQPAASVGNITRDTETHFYLYVGETTEDDYLAYVDSCSNAGFTVDYERDDRYYRAYNEAGYYLKLNYKGFSIMSISLDAPRETSDESATDTSLSSEDTSDTTQVSSEDSSNSASQDETATGSQGNLADAQDGSDSSTSSPDTLSTSENTASNTQDPSADTSETASANASSDTSTASTTEVDPDLKAFLDSYESVMNAYCDFMDQYDSASEAEQLSMSIEYLKLTGEYAEMLEKLDNYDTDTMSAADLAYYTEVTLRVEARLLQSAQ